MTSRVVVVVGAGSGIGLAAAIAFAARHDDLVLVSRSADALKAAEAACRDAGAGDVDAFVDTAVHGGVHLSRAVLPVMRRQHSGVFIGVDSLLGPVTVPGMGAYAAANWGQRAVLRTLQQETRDEPGVHVCVVSPGSVNTPVYYQAANCTGQAARPPWPVLAPERAGAAIVRLADRPRRHVSVPVGPGNPFTITGFRLLPLVHDRLVGPLFRLAALTRKRAEPTPGNVRQPVPGQERVHGHWPEPR